MWQKKAGNRDAPVDCNPHEKDTAERGLGSNREDVSGVEGYCCNKGKLYDQSVYPYNHGLGCCPWVSRSRRPATVLTAGRPPSSGQLGEDGPEREQETRIWECVAWSLGVCAEDRAKPVMDAGIYRYICGVQSIVADTSPLRKLPDGVDATMRPRSREARW